MPKKKKFIDKKKAVTFHLVHRSQHDPLVVDESAPQRVLVEAAPSKKDKKNIEEEHKFGIYYDDDYDYLQHLRDSSKAQVEWVETTTKSKDDKQKLSLPSSVFASEVEEEVGLLNKAAPQSGLRLELDPDIVAAMDEDFNYSDPENELEDNFVELANQPKSGSEAESEDEYEEGSEFEDDSEDDNSNYSDEQYDELGSLNEDAKSTKSRFTEYSMTSSIISRNSNLTLLDETFEQMYAGYDDMEIGALDCDDIEGELDINSHLFKIAADEFEKQRKKEELTTENIHQYIMDSDEEDLNNGYLHEIKEKEKWDCESILSTYSNIYNHPKLIKEPDNKIRVNKRTGIPMETAKLTKKALAQLEDTSMPKGPSSVLSTLSMLSIRDKNESLEEKKKRKHDLKEYRKIRRMERKANKQAFKDEQKRLEKTMAYNNLNHQGLKL